MDTPKTVEQIDKEIERNIQIIKIGRPTYSNLDIQLARDTVTRLNKERQEIDYNSRKPFIKVVKTNQPKGNSSTHANRGKRFNVHPGGQVVTDI